MRILPILFNTDMVRALLEERKTVTRRTVKPQPKSRLAFVSMGNGARRWSYPSASAWKYWDDKSYKLASELTDEDRRRFWTPPCCADDILYVRETWCVIGTDGTHNEYGYMADGVQYGTHWRPSIHMPKEAARIFLRVKSVRVERLRDITEEQARAEGFGSRAEFIEAFLAMYPDCTEESWVWVIEFERVDRPQRMDREVKGWTE